MGPDPATTIVHGRCTGHFAENDEFEPQTDVDALEDALRQAGRLVTFYRYPGTGHWFFEPDRTDAFDAAAAELALIAPWRFSKTPQTDAPAECLGGGRSSSGGSEPAVLGVQPQTHSDGKGKHQQLRDQGLPGRVDAQYRNCG